MSNKTPDRRRGAFLARLLFPSIFRVCRSADCAGYFTRRSASWCEVIACVERSGEQKVKNKKTKNATSGYYEYHTLYLVPTTEPAPGNKSE